VNLCILSLTDFSSRCFSKEKDAFKPSGLFHRLDAAQAGGANQGLGPPLG
jgi:hypothetical protein